MKTALKVIDAEAINVEDAATPNSGVPLYKMDGKARNLPIPSSDPNDPLNLSVWRQRLLLAVVCIYGVTSFGVIQSTPLFFPDLIGEYKRQNRGGFDPDRIVELASYPSLCMGMGNFFFVPMSMALGRRSALLLSNILLLASIIWAAKSTSFSSHLGARCLQGLTAGISDCLLPIIILDISFLHRRSTRLVAYWVFTSVGASLLLVTVPFVVNQANHDWRVNYWFWAGFSALSLLLVVFCAPETLFPRRAADLGGVVHVSDSYGTCRTFFSANEALAAGFEMTEDGSYLARPEVSYIRQFAPVSVQNSPALRFLNAYREIFMCLLVPGVFWALLYNSFVFGGIVALSLTYAARLEMEPWHFSPTAVGTVQVGAAVGALLGLAVGEMAEPVSRFFTRRNGGVREPEHVLPNFIVPSLVIFLGLAVYGVVAANPDDYSWFGVHLAFGLFYFGFCSVSALSGVWLGELLSHMSGPAIVLTCGGRNAVSFGYSSSFTKWIAQIGFMQTHVLFGGIIFGLGCVSIPLFFINKRIRKSMSSISWMRS